MTRNRASAKKAGSSFERSIADCLAEHVDPGIDRRVRNGSKDRGDIGGLRHMGNRIVCETKDYGGQIKAADWVTEAHVEMRNDDAMVGLVIAKRRGITDPGSQWVLMTVNDLIGLLTGHRPDGDL